jgi:hypothetical protein
MSFHDGRQVEYRIINYSHRAKVAGSRQVAVCFIPYSLLLIRGLDFS